MEYQFQKMNEETKKVEIITKKIEDLTEEDKGVIVKDLVTRFVTLDSAMKYNFLGNVVMLLLKHIDKLEDELSTIKTNDQTTISDSDVVNNG